MMKTLSKHNNDSYPKYSVSVSQPIPAGVLCDKCNTEMMIPNPNMVLSSYPPKRMVQCPKCNTIDYIVR
jgi:hypothetical protein